MNIKKIMKKLLRIKPSYFYETFYINYFNKYKINENTILIEPQQGRTINGSMFYILKELTSDKQYEKFEKYVVLNKKSIKSANEILKYNKIENVKIVRYLSNRYYKLLATAKYIITDTSLATSFIKKDGQKILNTWHGTPLKYLGKKIKNNYHSIGNVQKNFMISDYLLYPNEYTKEHLIEDYMLENISEAKSMLAGYPRNTAFFEEESRNTIRKELNIEDNAQILAYMPTWRENTNKNNENDENKSTITLKLMEIESKLNENQILYVNLHPLDRSSVDFSVFKKIKEFPSKYETYQFLNITDCLITDYSSVFFDYAITKKKIILFCYDEEEYLATRGLYFDYKLLPFAKAKTTDELIKEINTSKNYDDTDFINQFCKYDEKNITKKICEEFILNKKTDLKIEKIKNNGKENVLIYVGNLSKNGITSSINNLLSNIDLKERNYYITFSANKIYKNCEQLLKFPEDIMYISTVGKTNMNIMQKIKFVLYRKNLIPIKLMEKTINKVYKNEIKRLYGNAKFDTVIQFNGYEYKKILFYSAFDCNTVIYVHSNMLNEINVRKNQHLNTLKYAYNKYDKVVSVTEDIKESIYNISNREDNIYIAKNIINYKNVLGKSKIEEIKFDDYTESNYSIDEIKKVLNSNSKKFITIGRFSKEKGHARLIRAFERLYKENNDIFLLIIGGLGVEYDATIDLISTLESKNNIILIKDISNPYNILNKCDYFVLSSFYEGFGLVIAEADILNKPCISTDIEGPRIFMKDNNGELVPNNEDGLFEGMKKLLDGKINAMNVDYEQYNRIAVEEFYRILEK